MLIDDGKNMGGGNSCRRGIFWLNEYHGLLWVQIVMPDLGLYSILEPCQRWSANTLKLVLTSHT